MLSSALGRKFRETGRMIALVVLSFQGLTLRFSQYQCDVEDEGVSHRFDASIISISPISTRFDLSRWRYGTSDVQIELENSQRLQSYEERFLIDGAGTGSIYLWAPGLRLSQAKLVFRGTFYKDYHTRHKYVFTLRDQLSDKWGKIPDATLNTSDWPYLRTDGGDGSVANQGTPLVFGYFPKGAPLVCVDTQDYKYMLTRDQIKATESEYNSGTYEVYDKDGNVIDPANYTLDSVTDGSGRTVTVFTFNASYASYEPLTCSTRGIKNSKGALIENPIAIMRWLIANQTSITDDDLDLDSISAAENIVSSIKYATVINDVTDGANVVDRLLDQIYCPRLSLWGKQAILPFEAIGDQKAPHRISDVDLLSEPRFTKTSRDNLTNKLTIKYGYNHGQRSYEKTTVLDRTNNRTCNLSYIKLGNKELPQVIELPDVWDDTSAIAIGLRHLSIYGLSHDIVSFLVPFDKGLDMKPGDVGYLTLVDGWTDEKCILLDISIETKGIKQTWWRIAA